MPTYDYDCRACGATLEIFQSMSEAPRRKCPECGKLKLARRIGTGAGILFRGSGFYQTDYRPDSYKQAAEADRKSGAGSSAPKDGQESGTAKEPGAPKAPKAKEDGQGSSSQGGAASKGAPGSKGGTGKKSD